MGHRTKPKEEDRDRQNVSNPGNDGAAHPTWKSTFGPIQKKQSIIRKAKTIGMLLMNLRHRVH